MTFSLLQMAKSGILGIIKLLFYVIGVLFIVALATAVKDRMPYLHLHGVQKNHERQDFYMPIEPLL